MKQREILSDLSPDFRRENETQQAYLSKKKEASVDFVKRYVGASGARGVVLGVSGGVDSFLAGAICARAMKELGKKLYLVILPNGVQRDYADAADSVVQIKTIDPEAVTDTVSIEHAYAGAIKDLSAAQGFFDDSYTLGNLQPRIRMMYQYALAKGMLVVGTDHATEAITGFYTKYGDGGTDFNPLQELVKDDIYAMAAEFGAPAALLEKQPAAGLGISADDESELGMKYKDICAYLKGWKIDPEVSGKLEAAYDKSRHKRALPASLKDEYYIPAQATHLHMGAVCGTDVLARTAAYMNAHPGQNVLYVADEPEIRLCELVKKTVNTPIGHYNCFGALENGAENEAFGTVFENIRNNVVISGKTEEVAKILPSLESRGVCVTLAHGCLEK